MGIPKFFRYISERYPMTSQLIQENKIPEFDNLYLDFNGIIHNCSHPNDGDAHFRLSEEQVFTAIFSYVDLLFGKIKPKKLFFMAVDGVAPRAKMNQQRSRRFRTAKEAQELREKALRNGEKLPEEKAFDSNAITPGTPFMAKLSEQLKYFVNKKITEDANWRDIEVVLSGHEVPGEGEHKIMEYIRLAKAQPDYNPNVRHCLYGLDADLIMLGLLSHDPHFCLLREEVKFGPASRKRSNTNLESINFYLLHLCLMREYLDLEFHDIQASLPFEYNLERIIDDFILLAVFIGNDFLPNLPELHIHENGLERLFEVYKKVLPSLDGYLNNSGVIDTRRLQRILDEMHLWEREIFEKEHSDTNWIRGKQSKTMKEFADGKKRSKLVMTKPQEIIFNEVKAFVLANRASHSAQKTTPAAALSMPNTFPARERAFITALASDLNLDLAWDEYDDEDQNLVVWRFPDSRDTNAVLDGPLEEDDDTEEDEEDVAAVDRVLKKYGGAHVLDDEVDGDFDTRHERGIQEKMDEWKRDYYRDKLEFSFDDPKAMHDLVFRYVEGLQWVMHYYYSGVVSWGWFYNYHYAPRISDLQGVDKMSFSFELGKPFRPFEQLMGVLPAASKDLIPLAYQDLMYDPNSPILDFYPIKFEQDMNGKKQEWEAIVKIPFIEENRLLKAMGAREHRLTEEERRRNSFGTSTKFAYNPGQPTYYPSSLPGFFPALAQCACVMEPFNLPTLDGLHLVPGLCDGVALGVEALAGFPSIGTLPYTGMLGYHGVNVHGSESKNKSMVIHITNPYENEKTEKIANDMVGKRTFVNWPFSREGMVVAVSDSLFKYEKVPFGDGKQQRILSNPHAAQGLRFWKSKAERIEQYYSKRLGVITGSVDILLHVRPLKGLQRQEDGSFTKEYEDQDQELEQAVQMALPDVFCEDPRYLERDAPALREEFPPGTKVFFLGKIPYGAAAQITAAEDFTLSIVIAFIPSEDQDIAKFRSIVANRVSERYFSAYEVSTMLRISGHILSKVTSSFMVLTSDGQKANLGLSLKYEAKSLKVIGYSRKDGKVWEFSQAAVDLIREYKEKFPELFSKIGGPGDQMPSIDEIFSDDSEAKLKEVRSWLSSKGIKNLEAVSLFCDHLDKGAVLEIVTLCDSINEKRTTEGVKKVVVKSTPPQAVLKPAHATYRLQSQWFQLGDRVAMVQDSGGVPFALKGVVIGINSKTIDVVWDAAFISGTTLGDRCPLYRGSTVDFTTCLNLTHPQCEWSAQGKTAVKSQATPFRPRIGPRPAVQPASGQAPAAGFQPAPRDRGTPQMRIMSNPSRGRNGPSRNLDSKSNGDSWITDDSKFGTDWRVNGNANAEISAGRELWREMHGTANTNGQQQQQAPQSSRGAGGAQSSRRGPTSPPPTSSNVTQQPSSARSAQSSASKGRAGILPNLERGRASSTPRGIRPRGRGQAPVATATAS